MQGLRLLKGHKHFSTFAQAGTPFKGVLPHGLNNLSCTQILLCLMLKNDMGDLGFRLLRDHKHFQPHWARLLAILGVWLIPFSHQCETSHIPSQKAEIEARTSSNWILFGPKGVCLMLMGGWSFQSYIWNITVWKTTLELVLWTFFFWKKTLNQSLFPHIEDVQGQISKEEVCFNYFHQCGLGVSTDKGNNPGTASIPGYRYTIYSYVLMCDAETTFKMVLLISNN